MGESKGEDIYNQGGREIVMEWSWWMIGEMRWWFQCIMTVVRIE